MRKLLFLPVFILYTSISSCRKFIDVGAPKNELASVSVYKDDETAIAAMRGLYIQLDGSSFPGGSSSIGFLAGLSSDELSTLSVTTSHLFFYTNELVASESLINTNLWEKPYVTIFHANSILEGMAGSGNMTNATKKILEGEAKFIRAFMHFYLVNLFGDVPLATTTNYQVNNTAKRTPKDKVYQQIVTDLTDAKNLLRSDYAVEAGLRIRPNKWAAAAMLARVYLYMGEPDKAEAEATEVISQAALYSLPTNLDNAFLKTSSEAIWQILPTGTNWNTLDGASYIVITSNPTFELPQSLLNAFEAGDKRLTSWVGSFTSGTTTWRFPYKYKIRSGSNPLNEYYMVLRLAEQFLIRSEARALRDNIAGAQDDLNMIRSRADLDPTTAGNRTELLAAIEQERRIELFSEWGHRWFDLKRWNRATAVLAPIKSNWSANDMLYPVPETELGNNPNLKPQNPGY